MHCIIQHTAVIEKYTYLSGRDDKEDEESEEVED